MTAQDPWWKAPHGDAHDHVFDFVRRTMEAQGDVFDRHLKCETLYDPFSPAGDDGGDPSSRLANVQENVVAGNVDTVHAAIATTEVRTRIQTDGADWSTQRRARHMELYAEGLSKQLGLHRKCRLAFKSAAKKGNGLVKIWANRWREVKAEHVAIEDIIVPDSDSRGDGPPTQLHHVQRNVDREALIAEYPEYEEQIRNAHGPRSHHHGAAPLHDDKVVVIHSIRLPIGKRPPKRKKKGDKSTRKGPRYVPGRETLTTENCTLLDTEYHKPHYPLASICWLSREGSFYGISLVERIAGIQRALNKRNWQIERALDQNAVLTTYVRPADGNLVVRTTKIGNVAVVKGDYPQTPTPPAVHPETLRSRNDLKDASFEESGVSRLAAQSHKPAGLDSGAALREYREQTTIKFAPQEQDFEQLVLDAVALALEVCKDLGRDAPVIVRASRWQRVLPWDKVDIGEVRIQMAAASTLSRTPAGRMQTVLEWAQAGVITQDEARRLLRHPDLERSMSLYTAALESIEEQLEAILDGELVVPEPFDNLRMAIWRGTAQYHDARTGGAPEHILEAVRQYVVQATHIHLHKEAANGNAAGAAGAGAAAAAPLPEGPPTGAAPTAAFASQAMDLVAA